MGGKIIKFDPSRQPSRKIMGRVSEIEIKRKDLERWLRQEGDNLDDCLVRLAHLLVSKAADGYGIYLEKEDSEKLQLKL